ncbi:MAG: hypothetical protein N3G79_07015 [Sulfolobales archaeon]|nr:hypothetical protein [Sulfolobales archaeon]
MYESLTYNISIPTPTPTPPPPPPPVPPRNLTNATIPTIFRDREFCTRIQHSRVVNGIRVFDIDGDPKIIVLT